MVKKCEKHPRYKAINIPRCNCRKCWTYYIERNQGSNKLVNALVFLKNKAEENE